MPSSTDEAESSHDGESNTRRSGRATRQSGRVKNKPKYTLDDDDEIGGSRPESDEDSVDEPEKKSAPKVGRRNKGDEDEEEYHISEDEEESDVSEEFQEPSDSPSSDEYDAEDEGDEEEAWDRRRRRFVSIQAHRYYSGPNDLPPFLAEAVNRTAASRPMDFSQGGPRPTSLTHEQIQEIAKNAVSTLATVNPITGKKLPLLLPRAPVEQSEELRSAVSAELKQSITSLLMDPQTREAMIRRLQGASAVAARAGPSGVSAPTTAIPPRPLTHLAPRKIVKEPKVSIDPESLSASRPRRTPAKKIDYSSYFKEEESENEDLRVDGASDTDTEAGEQDVGIEKILSHRKVQGKEEEFLVKYWGMSYLHAEWVLRSELEEERGMPKRIKKFLSKPLAQHHFDDIHPFNPEFTQIDRIVFGWSHPDEDNPRKTLTSYLVKWSALPYEDATWEKEEVVQGISDGPDHIREYRSRLTLDQKRMGALPVGRRPDRSSWKPFEESPVYKADNRLRSYQLEGVNWLVFCWMNMQSCIIADEMGLGKTVQSVAFLDLIYQKFNVRGPFLIVCPLSTLPHWQREFEAWTDLNVIVYHGSKASRDVMYEYEFFFKNAQDQPIPGFTKFDVLITTYEMAMAGIEQLINITWRVGIFDEAHRLKNRQSKAADVLKTLEVEHKILLSGTPIQNSIEELWSLLNFLQPQRFYSEEEFLEDFGDLTNADDVEKLQALLKPLMLRRLKEDVEKSIPVKEETIIEVELTPVQKRYYRAILEKNFSFLTKGCTATNAPNLLNAMMELRKCCIHPYLIKGSEERIIEETGATTDEAIHNVMIQASGKLVLVDKLLKKLREGGHKVLIFSQMTRCLDILVDYLRWRNYPFERIDGAIKGSDRQAAIDRFCSPKHDSFVFLLCTRAGGVGINLTAADTVVIFDSDWNPQNDLQAQARCHRIGQTKSVKIYRLITRNTYERDMFDRAGMKLGLDKAVLQKMGPSLEGEGTAPQLSRKEVETLLKKGAYGVLMETDDASSRFCEEDIDQILERRTTVVRHDEPSARADKGTSIFSKASFTATAADDFDIDIDDPNFWELWAKKLDMNPKVLLSGSATGSTTVMDEPRMRRLIKRLKATELELEDDDKDDIVQGIPAQRTKTQAMTVIEWTAQERQLLARQLSYHGIGRFTDLLILFPARSKNDIIAAAKAFIKFSIDLAVAEGDCDEKFKEDAEKAILWKIDFDKVKPPESKKKGKSEEEVLEDLSEFAKQDIPYPGARRHQVLEFKSFVSGISEEERKHFAQKAKRLILRIQLTEMIKALMENNSSNPKGIPVPNNVAGATMPGWWGRDADVDLIIGTFRHGYGSYNLMKQDPESIFSTMKYGDKDDPENMIYEWPTSEALGQRLRKLLVNMEKRAQVASKLAAHQFVDLGDRRKSRGTKALAAESDEEETASSVRGKRGASGRTRRTAADAIKELKAAALRKWSVKERSEFHRLITLYGLPSIKTAADEEDSDDEASMFFKGDRRDWSVFRTLGEFDQDKTNGDFNEYSEEYLRIMELSKDKRSNPATEDVEDEEVYTEPLDDEAPRKKRGRPRKDEEKQDKLMPADKAKKAAHIIAIFKEVRDSLLKRADLAEILSRARRSAGLPKWWNCEEHDSPFLHGVAKYGLGASDRIILDSELPFKEIYNQALLDPTISSNASGRRSTRKQDDIHEGAGKKPSEIVGWPNTEVCLRRLEYLVDLVNNNAQRDTSKQSSKRKRKAKSENEEGMDDEELDMEIHESGYADDGFDEETEKPKLGKKSKIVA